MWARDGAERLAMSIQHDTSGSGYTKRLESLEYKRWKSILNVQRPYRWNIKRLKIGKTLDIGCGIGRYLKVLSTDSVGIDHNKDSVAFTKKLGFKAFVTADFVTSPEYREESFDSILISHVLEHMTNAEALTLVRKYVPLVKEGGRIIILCPQEKGFASDKTHIEMQDFKALRTLIESCGLRQQKAYSFPFPRVFGKLFTYNEFVVIGVKS
jgi:2-polyprenyl-3-methyl-5-hydroxy-6-metoxy-1,4-benzoquinol methylase